MNPGLSEPLRQAFAAVADILIPAAEGMPAASQVDIGGEVLERILTLRPELREAFLRGVRACAGKPPREAIETLNKTDQAAGSAIGLVASAGYYMDARVRALIGYPGQEDRPGDPDEEPEYVRNGMLRAVIDRGPIYRPTPKRSKP